MSGAIGPRSNYTFEINQYAGDVIAFEMQPHRERGIGVYLEELRRLTTLRNFPAEISDQPSLVKTVDYVKYGLVSETGQTSNIYPGDRPMQPHNLKNHSLIQ